MYKKNSFIFFLLFVICLAINCSTKRVVPKLKAGISPSELSAIHRSHLPNNNSPSVQVNNAIFNGVLLSPIVLPTDSYCVGTILFNAWGGRCVCYAGYKNLESAIYNNMKVSLEDRLSLNEWDKDYSQYLIKVTIDSVTIKTRYNFRRVIALGYDSHKEFCEPTEMTLKVQYELLRKDSLLKRDTILKTKMISERICEEYVVLDSSNVSKYIPGGNCKAGGPWGNTTLIMYNAMTYSYFRFNQLINDCADEITLDVIEKLKQN